MPDPTYKVILWDGQSNLTLDRYIHTNPIYYVNITISSTKVITAKFTHIDRSNGHYWFGYDIALRIWQGNRNKRTNANIYGKQRWTWDNVYNPNNLTITVNDFKNCDLPIYIEPLCQGCDTPNYLDCVPFSEYGSSSFIYEVIKSHICINPDIPILNNVTGKTTTLSTVNNYQIGIRTSNNNYIYKKYNGTGIIFDKINSTDYFIVRKTCDCGKILTSNEKKVTYWTINGNATPTNQNTFHKLTFSAKHSAGTEANSNNKQIIYKLYKILKRDSNYKIIDEEYIEYKKGLSGGSVTFNNLDPATNYNCKMCTDGIEDNITSQQRWTSKPYTATDEISDISLGKVELKLYINKNQTGKLKYNIYIGEVSLNNVNELQPIKSGEYDIDENIPSVINISIDNITTTEEKQYKIFIVYNGVSKSQTNYNDSSECIETIHTHTFTSIYRNKKELKLSIKKITSRCINFNINLTLKESEALQLTGNNAVNFFYCINEMGTNINNYIQINNNKINYNNITIDGENYIEYFIRSGYIISNLKHNISYNLLFKIEDNNTLLYNNNISFSTKKFELEEINTDIIDNKITIIFTPKIGLINKKYDEIIGGPSTFSFKYHTLYLIPKNNQDIISNNNFVEDYDTDNRRIYIYRIDPTINNSGDSINVIYKNLIYDHEYEYRCGFTDGNKNQYNIDNNIYGGINQIDKLIRFRIDYEGCVYIYDGEKWNKCIMYIYDGENWKMCMPYIYDGENWRLLS
jgi:hypothetical protein